MAFQVLRKWGRPCIPCPFSLAIVNTLRS